MLNNLRRDNKLKRKRSIYLLSNLFTTGSIFAGFYAIVAALQGLFDLAAIAIFIAMLLDGLDGPIARLTNTESAFGAQYDSLSDMVSFGIAPALVMYSWGLEPLGKPGWIAAFFFVAATAMRLARFNTQEDKHFFYGIPSTLAAGMIASIVWVINVFNIGMFTGLSWLLAGMMIMLALLMVSNIRYYSPKQLDFKAKIPFLGLLAFLILLVAVASQPPIMLFTLFSLYTLSGIVITMYRWYLVHRLRRQRRDKKVSKHDLSENEATMENQSEYIFTSEKQKNTTPMQALKRLKAGNERFLMGKLQDRDLLLLTSYTAKHGQTPFAVVLSCIDSRSVPEIVFDQSIGDIFTARVPGNVINNDILASMEYGSQVMGAKLIVIMGHTHCGAVNAACQKIKMGNITGLLEKIQPAVGELARDIEVKNFQSPELIDQIAKQNVLNMIHKTLQESSILQSLSMNGEIIIIGGMHDIESGKVIFFDGDGKAI